MTKQIARCGEFNLPCSADTAFPLFSPEGERDWIQGWNPRAVFPNTLAFRRDTVFREGEGDDEAIWTILDADPQTRRAEYVRVAPASHTAHIVVKVDVIGPERSRVFVSYTVTAFGERSESVLDAFSERAYMARMTHWQNLIGIFLADREG